MNKRKCELCNRELNWITEGEADCFRKLNKFAEREYVRDLIKQYKKLKK